MSSLANIVILGDYERALRRFSQWESLDQRAKIAIHTVLDEDQVRVGFSGYDAFVSKAASPRLLCERVDGLVRGTVAAQPAA